jgi:hypothetical protein
MTDHLITEPQDHRADPAQPWTSPSISLIGSFRKHYDQVRETAMFFAGNGITVLSPSISEILEEGAEYVRFKSDPPNMENHDIQAITLARLLASDAVYVIAPGGYIGLDTAVEIGHLLQAGVQLFFSEPLKNVTFAGGPGSVFPPAGLLELVTRQGHGREIG